MSARPALDRVGRDGELRLGFERRGAGTVVARARFTELVESSREMISDLMQTHLAAVSNKLSEVMKVLTMISTVILPMTLIAGIYGMNFEVLPEKSWRLGYPFALGLMGLIGVASLIFFRWRRWI